MSKKLILGLALALVLVSGSFFGARAECSSCAPQANLSSSCASCSGQSSFNRDMDRAEATCQGAYNYGPTAPIIMGAPAF